MKLSELIKDIGACKLKGGPDVEVCDIAYNSIAVTKGVCFVAIRGMKTDGHAYIKDALSRGAVAVVTETPVSVPDGVVNVVVGSPRFALAKMSARFFGDPSQGLSLVGVTGTNGKTTITYLLEALFMAAGRRPGVVGTVEYRYAGIREKAPHTTPESYELQKLLSRMREKRVDICAMEVSSHALSQGRVVGCNFDAAVFTNLSPEHLDFHNDMGSYFEAKAILFEKLLAASGKREPFAVINADDPYGRMLAGRSQAPVVSFGIDTDSDVVGRDLKFDANGLSLEIVTKAGNFRCASELCGRFNAINILAAAAVASKLGIDTKAIVKGIALTSIVPGRFERVENKRGIFAIVDYAHKAHALENVLSHAREIALSHGGRLIVVFGCGGDRDRSKRPVMGRVAASIADIVIVTSDNPRAEDPNAIIAEIMVGVREMKGPLKDGLGYEVVENRREAISLATRLAREGDVLVIAGKGHEDYQIIGTERFHFDDREVLKQCLSV